MLRTMGGGVWNGSRNPSIVGAWAVIQAGGTGKLHSSYNVATYTDGGAGVHALTFTIPFASASEYAIVGSCSPTTTNTQIYVNETTDATANSVSVVTINTSNALVDQDPTMVICVGRR